MTDASHFIAFAPYGIIRVMTGWIRKNKKLCLIMVASLSALFLLVLVIILVAGRKEKASGVSRLPVSGNTPAMVFIDDPEATQDISFERPEHTEQTADPQIKSAEDETTREEIETRLASLDGFLPRHDTGYIFVGDSRFVHMNQVCNISDNENLFVVAKVGEGYNWFADTGMSQIKRIISSGLFDKWKIVICLGINDLENIERYKEKYRGLQDTYDISLVSVNPITSYGSLSNEKIADFNSGIKELDLPYIDTYRMLDLTGYTTTDGLHYDSETSKKIFKGRTSGM